MALSFNQTSGAAKKEKLNTYKYEDGENKIRIVGDILARYVYWVKGENDKNIPMECLGFDRNSETFTNAEKDWVREFYPDAKCGWSYVTQCIHNGEVKVLNLKRKLWDQIKDAAVDLGDPTDPEEGWDVVFTRKKTGPHIFNVEYTLNALRCKKRALDEDEMELFNELRSMDEVMPRPTPDAQKELLDRINKANAPEEVDEEALDEEFKVGA